MEKEEILEEEQELTQEIEEELQNMQDNSDDMSTEDINFLKAKCEKNEKESAEFKDRLLRLQADFENYKKRTQKEKQSLMTYASEGLLTEILPALDSFDRALEVEVDENSKALYEGMQMVYTQLTEVLKNNGLEEVECLNEKFDHNCHHAVVQQESKEHDEDTVIQVLGKGYKYKDKVIRPSMVMVSK